MADQAVSLLPAAPALTGSEIVMIVSGGNSDRTTTADIAALAAGSGGAGSSGGSSQVEIFQQAFFNDAAGAWNSAAFALPQPTTAGNTLVCIAFVTSFSNGTPPTPPSGYTEISAALPDGSHVFIWTKATTGGTDKSIAPGGSNGFYFNGCSAIFLETSPLAGPLTIQANANAQGFNYLAGPAAAPAGALLIGGIHMARNDISYTFVTTLDWSNFYNPTSADFTKWVMKRTYGAGTEFQAVISGNDNGNHAGFIVALH